MSKPILVAIDFSEGTDSVLEAACRLARDLQEKLYIVHVVQVRPDAVGIEVGPVYSREHVAKQLRQEHRLILEKEKMVQGLGVECSAVLLRGGIAGQILDRAEMVDALMIVLGSHGHGALYHLLMGSVCESILKKSSRPVLVIPVKAGAPTGEMVSDVEQAGKKARSL